MDRLEVMETLKHLPEAIEAEIHGLSENTMRYRPADGEWSIKETIGHLRDYAEIWSQRFHMIWSQTDPLFINHDQVQSVIDANYQDADLRKVIEELKMYRLRAVGTLSHAVDWTRLGQQPGVGRRTLHQFGERQIDHDNNHLQQIRNLKAQAAETASLRA
jgi:hypothetical protein